MPDRLRCAREPVQIADQVIVPDIACITSSPFHTRYGPSWPNGVMDVRMARGFSRWSVSHRDRGDRDGRGGKDDHDVGAAGHLRRATAAAGCLEVEDEAPRHRQRMPAARPASGASTPSALAPRCATRSPPRLDADNVGAKVAEDFPQRARRSPVEVEDARCASGGAVMSGCGMARVRRGRRRNGGAADDPRVGRPGTGSPARAPRVSPSGCNPYPGCRAGWPGCR